MEYKNNKRPIFGVIAAQAADMEQHQILNGIIEQAQNFNIDIAVFTNIYNPNEPNPSLYSENEIYDLILSPELDGIILISEAIINTDLQKRIKHNLESRNPIPVILIGTPLNSFDLSDLTVVNTDDENDIEDITNHLIEAHGFTDIHILTGHNFLEASNLRVNGYKKSLEKHGIPFDSNKVFYGDFWMNSGTALACRYINGELKFPEAILCTNDYMSYGLLDKFMECGIDIPDKVTVIGYEYVRERLYHYPILTTYQRNRKALGIKAINLLLKKINVAAETDILLKGEIIYEKSCSCGIKQDQFFKELQSVRTKKTYDFLNLFSQMDHRLTECKSISDFVNVLHDFIFLIRDVNEVYLCLSENWYDDNPGSSVMECYKIISNKDKETLSKIDKYSFTDIFSRVPYSAAYFFNPLFFADKMMGYVILRYDYPDTYDHIFRNWLKSVSNALEFLRMKNDIRYLLQCQNISEYYDSSTGLYNLTGFENAVNFSALAAPKKSLILLILKTEIFSSEIRFEKQDIIVSITNEIADALKSFSINKNDLFGRINRNTYACALIGYFADDYADLITDKLKTLILHKTHYTNEFGMDSFVCCYKIFNNMQYFSLKDALSEINNIINENILERSKKRSMFQYKEFQELRDSIYLNPAEKVNPEVLCRELNIGIAHFRHVYKNFFGISFNQDCIASRMSLAKFLLFTTSFDVNTIAAKCGYSDEKYFMRLFQKNTSFTPSQYRKRFYLNV